MINAAVSESIPVVNQNRTSCLKNDDGLLCDDFMSNILKAAKEIGIGEESMPMDSEKTCSEQNDDNTENPDVLIMCMQMNSLNVPDMQIPENSFDIDMLSDGESSSSDIDIADAEKITAFSMQNDDLLYKNTNLSDFTVENMDSQPIIQMYDNFSDIQENVQDYDNSADIQTEVQDIVSVNEDIVLPEITGTQNTVDEKVYNDIQNTVTDNVQTDRNVPEMNMQTAADAVQNNEKIAENTEKHEVQTVDYSDKIPQDNVLSYVQAEVAGNFSYTENVKDVSAVSDNRKTENSAVKLSDADNTGTDKNIPKISVQFSKSGNNAEAGLSQDKSSSFGENSQKSESFSDALIREHRIQSDFRRNIDAVKEIIRNIDANSSGEKSAAQLTELSAGNLDIAGMQTLFIPHNDLQIMADIQNNEFDETSEIVNQTFNGIVSKINGNGEQFTIKLNPDGLGEITVTIIKHDNSSILTLSASETKTAEILNSNMKVLQENLKYLNIEIADVQVSETEQSENYQSYNHGFEQNSSKYKKNDGKHHNDDDDIEENDYSVEDVLYSD
ncbi:MAG: flagellar hook-length control protein FliK [Oscillospiraceae bacterium]